MFRNDGGLNFTDVSYDAGVAPATIPYVGWGDAFADLDNDGWVDLALVNGHVYPQVDTKDIGTKYHEPKLLFLNQHNPGHFGGDPTKRLDLWFRRRKRVEGLGCRATLFNDGHLELVIENIEGSPMILRTEPGPKNHWVGLELTGTKSNRLALNARVRVTAGMTSSNGR